MKQSDREHRLSKDRIYPQVGDADFSKAVPPTPVVTDDLARTPSKNTQIFSSFLSTTDLTQEDAATKISNLTGGELHAYLATCHQFETVMTYPAAARLVVDFKAAKKRKEAYYGFRNFDLMCKGLTGFSGTQIRTYAKGYKTPPKKAAAKKISVPASDEQLKYRDEVKKLQAKIDETSAQARLETQQKNDAAVNVARDAVKTETAIVVSNPVRSVAVVNPVALRDACELDKAVILVNRFLLALPASKLTAEQKSLKGDGLKFLRDHGGLKLTMPAEKMSAEKTDGGSEGNIAKVASA
jgi:hypothetical protein